MFGCFTTLKQSRFNLFGALVKTKRSLDRRQRNTGLGKCPIEYKITWIEFSCVNHWVMERKWHSYKSAENRLSSKTEWVSMKEATRRSLPSLKEIQVTESQTRETMQTTKSWPGALPVASRKSSQEKVTQKKNPHMTSQLQFCQMTRVKVWTQLEEGSLVWWDW